MSEARIYRPAKTAMQSGRNNTKQWILEFEPAEARRADALMGWISSGDTNAQVRLRFATKEDAVAYADKHGLSYQVQAPKARRIKPKNYSDNFSYRFRYQ